MQQTNNPNRYIGMTSLSWSESEYQAINGSRIATSSRNTSRRYQRGWSKHSIKVARYSDSGNIHRNGSDATFWVMCVVTASSRNVAIAASVSQINWRPPLGG